MVTIMKTIHISSINLGGLVFCLGLEVPSCGGCDAIFSSLLVDVGSIDISNQRLWNAMEHGNISCYLLLFCDHEGSRLSTASVNGVVS